MSRSLILIRHGKSDQGLDIRDFDRPLNHRGNKNAVEMAERTLKKDPIPQQLISSPALRAITTARHFAEVWDLPFTLIKQESSIYEANVMALLKVISNLDDNFNNVALFGHNPGLTDFANYLSDANIYNIPTSGIVVLELSIEKWIEASKHTGIMRSLDFPKNTDEPH
jgi:phosphohistidine phosphatase